MLCRNDAPAPPRSMGKRKKESEAHKRKRENREKIIVNLEL